MKSKYTVTKITCYIGYVVQAVINNFLPILFIVFQDIYGMGYEKLARLIAVNFITQIVTDILTPKIVNKIGYRKAIIMCQAAATTGLLMLGILPRFVSHVYPVLVVSIMVYAFGSGLIEVLFSPVIEHLPIDNKSGNMSLLHSFYCWGQAFTIIVTTVLVSLFSFRGWANIPLIWAILPFIDMLLFIKAPIVEPEAEEKEQGFCELFKNRQFKLYMLMMLCAGASEIAMAEWASMFAQQSLGVSKVIGDLTGPCLFAVFMGTGRIWYAAVSEKVSFIKTIVILNVVCTVCYLGVAFCKIPVLALVFCAICGFTVSVSWPGIYSLGAASFPKGNAVMYSTFAFCGDMGCCLGPWVLGIVAEFFGLNTGFAVSAVFPIIMVVASLFSVKKDCKNSKNSVK